MPNVSAWSQLPPLSVARSHSTTLTQFRAGSAIWLTLLLFLGLLPGSVERVWQVGGASIPWRELGPLAAFAAIIATIIALGRPMGPTARGRGKTWPAELWIATLWVSWVCFRWRTGPNGPNPDGVVILLVSTAVLLIPAWVTHVALAAGRLEAVYRWTILVILFLLTVYFGESAGVTNWRVQKFIDPWQGSHRLNGPLVGSNYAGAVLVLCMAYTVYRASRTGGRHRTWWWAACAWLVVLWLMTGSRGGVGTLAIFAFALLIATGRAGPALVVTVVGAVAVLIASEFMSFDRLTVTEDPFRADVYDTTYSGWLSSPSITWFGYGLGAVYPWHHHESQQILLRLSSALDWQVMTPVGESFAHPHTTPGYLLVETGIIGCIILMWLPTVEALRGGLLVLRRGFRLGAGWPNLAELSGIAAMSAYPLILVNTYFLHHYGVSLGLWFLILATRRLRRAEQLAARPAVVPDS